MRPKGLTIVLIIIISLSVYWIFAFYNRNSSISNVTSTFTESPENTENDDMSDGVYVVGVIEEVKNQVDVDFNYSIKVNGKSILLVISGEMLPESLEKVRNTEVGSIEPGLLKGLKSGDKIEAYVGVPDKESIGYGEYDYSIYGNKNYFIKRHILQE